MTSDKACRVRTFSWVFGEQCLSVPEDTGLSFPMIVSDLGSLALSWLWKTFELLPGRGVSMNLTREQVRLSVMNKVGFLFERGNMLVDQGNYRRHCSDALNSYFHKVAPHTWYAHHHMTTFGQKRAQQHPPSVCIYISLPPTNSLGTYWKMK